MYAACVHMHTGCISKCFRMKLWHTGWHPCTFIPTPCLRHCSRLHIKELRSLYEKQHRPAWSHSTGKCGVNGKCFFLASHGTCNFSHCTERCSKGNTHVSKNREMQEPWLQSQVLWEQRQQRQRNIHRPISPPGWTQVLSIQIGWSRRMAWKVHSEMINFKLFPSVPAGVVLKGCWILRKGYSCKARTFQIHGCGWLINYQAVTNHWNHVASIYNRSV